MNLFNNRYLRIVVVLIIAYLISDTSVKNVFLGQSPKIDPLLVSKLAVKVNNFWSRSTNFIASIKLFPGSTTPPTKSPTAGQQENNFAFTGNQIEEILQAPLKKVSSGVYAGEKNNVQVYEVRSNEIDYLEYTFTVNGKEIKIKVPKDQQPPSQDVVEALYK